VYDPGTADGWKLLVRHAILQSRPEKPFAGAIEVQVAFCMPRPKSHYRKGILRPDAPHFHTGRPDLDNLLKAVMDAIGDTHAVWIDDAQVSRVAAAKIYSDTPGAVITISGSPDEIVHNETH
jgi:Holliday junction resolvase RusA-like endonuclease